MKPKLVRTVAALRRETAKWRSDGLTYAVVPTWAPFIPATPNWLHKA